MSLQKLAFVILAASLYTSAQAEISQQPALLENLSTQEIINITSSEQSRIRGQEGSRVTLANKCRLSAYEVCYWNKLKRISKNKYELPAKTSWGTTVILSH